MVKGKDGVGGNVVPGQDRQLEFTILRTLESLEAAMSFLGLDTHPKAAAVQLDLLRRSSVERRAALARSLSSTVIELSRRALRDNMKPAAEAEVMDRWVALNYGEDLAGRIRRYILARTP